MPRIKVNGILLFYTVYADGSQTEELSPTKSTMLVYHGGPGVVDHQIEIPFWSQFAVGDLQVVFVDHRGNGQSEDGDPASWTIEQCAEDINGLINSLGITKPIVAGISWGGYVVQRFLCKYPQLPCAAILFNTEAKVDFAARKAAFTRVANLNIAELAWEDDNDPSEANDRRYFDACVPYFSANPLTLTAPRRVNWDMRLRYITNEHGKFDFREALKSVQCPILQVAGDDDPVHPVVCAEETAECIPKQYRNLVRLAKAGTPAYHDQPQAAADAVNKFLSETLEFDPTTALRIEFS